MRRWFRVALLAASCAVVAFTVVEAQEFKNLFDLGTNRLGGENVGLEPQVNVRLISVDPKPGEEATLAIEVTLPEGSYTYSTSRKFGGGTRIRITQATGLEPLGDDFVADRPPTVVFEPLFKQEIEKFTEKVTWVRRYRIAAEAGVPQVSVQGELSYQVCNKQSCTPLKRGIDVALTSAGADDPVFAIGRLASQPAEGAAASAVEAGSIDFKSTDEASSAGLPMYLFYAFLGGLILNVMPCVLPVIAIKVLSFVQQAGESHGRIVALNVAYSLGVISVFLFLATLAVQIGLGWGGLFQNSEFNLLMACLVFAMGLSLLGVFDIPVPGLVGSAAGKHQQEGLPGAFLTGVFATLLATPCSGPFLGATLGWSFRQTPEVTYLVWGTMGLGMASPYLLFGLFPGAIRFLPKPGAWMVRFKEFAGFVLMGTVIFFVNFIDRAYTIPLLIMLLGISLGLWMVGNLYDINSHIRHKTTVRICATVLTVGICLFGYRMAKQQEDVVRLPWLAFSEARLSESLSGRRTVLVDFTADWCLTCKTVEKFALNTPETLNLVEQHGIVPLYADYTQQSDEIKQWLDKFDSKSVPLTVIFPGDEPTRPIILRDVYTQSTLLESLKQAVGTDRPGSQAKRVLSTLQ